MFLIVDHYEPAKADGDKSTERVREWCEGYMNISKNHADSDGIHPLHSWFYRYDYPRYENIRMLSEYVFKDFGEIEFHLHHEHDTPDNFIKTIKEGVEWFNQAGAMISAEALPEKNFAYIAGNWALDNGQNNPEFSGVNTEISILKDQNCYADFTFPAFGQRSQPKIVNKIYYATDTPEPKSYDTGVEVEVGKDPSGDLMIFQGPLFIDWDTAFTESAAFEKFAEYTPLRLNCWKNAHIHVKGKPEWVFIKLHTHGMQSKNIFLDTNFDEMCSALEAKFKEKPFCLHYVTAREAYNIVKAAEAGESGNPNQYRDYLIKEPVNKKIFCDNPYQIDTYSDSRIKLQIKGQGESIQVLFKDSPLNSLTGDGISHIDLQFDKNRVQLLTITGHGKCRLDFKSGAKTQPGDLTGDLNLPFKFKA